MIVVLALVLACLSTQQQGSCSDVAACRTKAEAARQAGDYETFHDFAWAAYRHGKSTDTELMLLVARAQSLSGRPGDALVMLERIAELGGASDAATSEDFIRVRALPRWSEVAGKLSAEAKAADVSGAPAAVKTAGKRPDTRREKSAETPPATPTIEPGRKPAPKTPEKPAVTTPDPALPVTTTPGKPIDPKEMPAGKRGPDPSKDDSAVPLTFTTLLTPGALTFDAVSQRFLIADRKLRRIAVIDANTGQVATMVGALDSAGEIAGMAIDVRQGDLWIASTNGEGSVLHKLQLISGRLLQAVPLSIEDPVVAMTYVRATGLVVADAKGTVWRLRANGKAEKLANLEYVPLGLASDASGRLYVAGGASRIARFSVSSTLRKIDTLELAEEVPSNAPFAVSGGRIHFVVPESGSFTIRSFPVR